MIDHQIIKMGSACLFDDYGNINAWQLRQKAEAIKALDYVHNIKTTLVVSGAIALGKREYGDERKNDWLTATELQRYACKGQIKLMKL